MKKLIKKFIQWFILPFLALSLSSCATNDGKIDPNGSKIANSILSNEILEQDILIEDELQEYIVESERIIEETLNEDIILEDVQVDIIVVGDLEDRFNEYYFFSDEAGMYDIDWWKVLGQFAVGTAVIVVTGIATYVTSEIPGIGYIFATSCKEALKQAVIGAAVGGALNVIIKTIQNGGKVDAVAKYAIEGAAEGFMWGAITGALTGAFSGYISYYKNTNKVFEGNKLIGELNKKGELVKDGVVTGYKNQQGYILDKAGNVLGMADDAGNFIATTSSLIPSSGKILNATGKSVTYTINASNQVIDKSGKIVGFINDAGQIIDANGNLIRQVDRAGRLINDITKTVKAGFNLSPSGFITNTTKIVDGVTQYLDDAGNVIGSIMKATNSADDVVNYLVINVDPSKVKFIGDLPKEGLQKIVGQVDDAGNLVGNWLKHFQYERSKGVALAWKAEMELVQKVKHGTREWGPDEIAKLMNNKKVPGYQGHHINSALYSPHLAANPDNIIFYNRAEHLALGHGGDFRNVTFGELFNRLAMMLGG